MALLTVAAALVLGCALVQRDLARLGDGPHGPRERGGRVGRLAGPVAGRLAGRGWLVLAAVTAALMLPRLWGLLT